MKRKYLSILLVICMVFTMLPTTVFAAGSDSVPALPTAAEYAADAINGTDYTTQGTTLTIRTAKGAAFWSANGLTYLNYTIKLDADIDVSGFQWTPVGNTDGIDNNTPFSGTFDGQGHTISGISYANDLQDTGVIGSVSGGAIKSLTVRGSISVTQAASGWAFVAGIVSVASDSTITDCHSEVQIESNVSNNLIAGGIVAAASDNVKVDGCSNSGAVSGSAIGMTFIGGIAGDMEVLTAGSSIKNCANTGALTANSIGDYFSMTQLGGIVGNKMDNTTSGDEHINVVVENCYNTGALNATAVGLNYVGGISGNNGGDSCDCISNCYNAGAVSGSAILASINSGIVGSNNPGSVFSSYWKADTAATCVQAGGFVYNCGTFDYTGNLSATTDVNAGTTHSEHGLLYGSNLLDGLNGWVEANPDSGCCKWKADSTASPVNGGYPVFDAKSTETTFDLCNGAPTVSVKPSVDPAWETTGYTFAGWYTKPNGEGSQLTGAGDDGVTYYAKWTVGMGANLRTVRTTMLDLSSQASDEDKLSSEGWAWYSSAGTAPNHTVKTLVLSGLTLNTTGAAALIVPDGTTILLTAGTTNSIKGGDVTSDGGNVFVCGIYGTGALTLQGSGTLNVIGGTATCTNDYISNSVGIYIMGNLNIADAVTINATGGEANVSYGIFSNSVEISGGTVAGYGGMANKDSCGIYSPSSISILGGTVEGIGGNAGTGSYGICSASENDGEAIKLTVTGGRVTAKSGAAADKAAILTFNSSEEPGSSATLIVGSSTWPAAIANATDGTTAITGSRGTIASGKLIMSGSDAVNINFPDHSGTNTGGGTYTGGGTITGGDSNNSPADNTSKTKDNSPVEVTAVSDSNGNGSVTITQDKLNEILKAAQQSAAQQGGSEDGVIAELTVNMPEDTRSLTLTLPQEVQDTLVKEHVTELKINSNAIEIVFDEAALAAISHTAGMDVQITAKPSDVQSAKVRAAVGNRPVLDLTLSYGGNIMSSFGTGNVYVGIPYTLGKNEQAGNIAAVYIDKKGKVSWLTNSSYDAIRKMVIFITPHLSTYGVAYKSNTPKFKDIAGHWAKDDILFAVNRGLLTGTAKDKFSPDLPITRGMLVTALGRLAQADVSGYKKSSFIDVSADAYYMGYAEWANKNSILKGIGGKKYAPNASITREQLAVILDRYATVTGFKLPAVRTECTFADADKIDSQAKDAVQRLQMAGIIDSKAGNLFDPQGKATRAEVSAMLKCFIELTINTFDRNGETADAPKESEK